MRTTSISRTCALALLCAILAGGCGEAWNNPYPASGAADRSLYTSFTERPKYLDPAKSYSEDEAEFNSQVYEPPFQYHYFKRPYELAAATALEIPRPRYLDAQGRELAADAAATDIATSVYDIRIRAGIRYAPHPAFIDTNRGLTRAQIAPRYTLADFGAGATRELTAADYVYEIKRLAHPKINSPIFGHMADYIVGLQEYGELLKRESTKLEAEGGRDAWLDLRKFELSGVRALDATTYRITVKGKYPQFLFWMAMPFFAPIPWEADEFYAQAGMAEKNFSFNWYPVGTGPYMLTENNPNARMVLERNPHFRGEPYPSEGEAGDREAGLLADAGKSMPFIDRIVFSREKEAIPACNKFLQGYYDKSGIASDNFDQAIRMGGEGDAMLTPEMEQRGISLRTSLSTSTLYLAFNWQDPVVGGADPVRRKLRQAISIAVDYDEFISIFLNGRGIAAQGPVPPGIFGFREGRESVNPVVFDWRDGRAVRKPLDTAKKLLAEAGYPDGRDAKTGAPLVIALDTVDRGPGDKARLDWYRKQFADTRQVSLVTFGDWNRFQEKIRKGNTQTFFLGWNADYPDPENFMFLLYGPNSSVKGDGENKSNYVNPEFDRLFEQMKNLDNGPARQAIIDRMMAVVREDAPWIWAYHPMSYGLSHAWVANGKPNQMARNGLKYQKIDTALRAQKRAEWNRPVAWPFVLLLIGAAMLAWLGVRAWRRAEAAVAAPRGAGA